MLSIIYLCYYTTGKCAWLELGGIHSSVCNRSERSDRSEPREYSVLDSESVFKAREKKTVVNSIESGREIKEYKKGDFASQKQVRRYPGFFFFFPMCSVFLFPYHRPTLLRHMDMGCLTSAHMLVRAVHTTAVRHKDVLAKAI